jgi:hypothetical protein
MIFKTFLLLLLGTMRISTIFSQTVGLGASGIYNFQSEGLGVGLRVSLFPNEKISIVPQYSYFFPFNKVNEYYLGITGEYKVLQKDKFNLYGLLQGGYNSWLNFEDSPMIDATRSNWNLEGGLGISTKTCLRPLIEYRYNVKHKETNLQVGLLYIIGCPKKTTRKKSTTGHCDAYN